MALGILANGLGMLCFLAFVSLAATAAAASCLLGRRPNDHTRRSEHGEVVGLWGTMPGVARYGWGGEEASSLEDTDETIRMLNIESGSLFLCLDS